MSTLSHPPATAVGGIVSVAVIRMVYSRPDVMAARSGRRGADRPGQGGHPPPPLGHVEDHNPNELSCSL